MYKAWRHVLSTGIGCNSCFGCSSLHFDVQLLIHESLVKNMPEAFASQLDGTMHDYPRNRKSHQVTNRMGGCLVHQLYADCGSVTAGSLYSASHACHDAVAALQLSAFEYMCCIQPRAVLGNLENTSQNPPIYTLLSVARQHRKSNRGSNALNPTIIMTIPINPTLRVP